MSSAVAEVPSMQKVVWSFQERIKIADILLGQKVSPDSDDFFEKLLEAQKVLPTHRQRTFSSRSLSLTFEHFYRTIWKRHQTQAVVVVDSPVVESVVQLPTSEKPPADTEELFIELSLMFNGIETQLGGLRSELSDQMQFICDYLWEMDKSPKVEIRENPNQPVKVAALPVANAGRKPKIFIFGTDADQQNIIEREFGDRFNLVQIERANPSIKQHSDSADAVILLTKHLPHSVYTIIKRYASGKLYMANGAAESVKTILRQLERTA